MPWRNALEKNFPRYGAAHGHAQEPAPGSTVEFTSKRGCSIKRRRGRHIPPFFGVIRVAYPKA